ncbi:hypothetical protein [Bradyrhizobium phage BDU-MI-1]|nr:hypothetical protein [Bradyrhizobium phage BDU-MI-1]
MSWEDNDYIFRRPAYGSGGPLRTESDPGEWRSVSVLGDPWEVEMDIHSDRYRYRSAMFGRIRTEWSYGRPPTGAHAEKRTEK